MRRLAPLSLVVLALAACGGGNKSSSGPSDEAQIKAAYAKFFAGKTAISDRVALLENGSQFQPVIQAFASNPLAKNASVTVSSVKLQGADKANVVYTVKLGGTALPQQTGAAVRQNGKWKVSDATLCKLVALGGTTPSVCQKS